MPRIIPLGGVLVSFRETVRDTICCFDKPCILDLLAHHFPRPSLDPLEYNNKFYAKYCDGKDLSSIFIFMAAFNFQLILILLSCESSSIVWSPSMACYCPAPTQTQSHRFLHTTDINCIAHPRPTKSNIKILHYKPMQLLTTTIIQAITNSTTQQRIVPPSPPQSSPHSSPYTTDSLFHTACST